MYVKYYHASGAEHFVTEIKLKYVKVFLLHLITSHKSQNYPVNVMFCS